MHVLLACPIGYVLLAMTRLYHILPAADRDLDDPAAYLAAEASLGTA
jgi:hypothetical protein